MNASRAGGRPAHMYWAELKFEMVRPSDNAKRNGAYCLFCKKTLKNTAVGRLRAHRKTCGNQEIKTATYLKFKAEESGDEEQEQTWELQQTSGSVNENEPETYQIVETADESYNHENSVPIHTIQTIVPSSTNVADVVDQEIAQRVSKKPKKEKIYSPAIKSTQRHKEYTFVDINQTTPAMSLSKKEEIDRALSIFVIGCNLSFDMVDTDYFRDFVSSLCPNYRIPTSKSLKSDVLNKLANQASTSSYTIGNGYQQSRRNLEDNSDDDSDHHDTSKRIKI